jgi:hypothetical protein
LIVIRTVIADMRAIRVDGRQHVDSRKAHRADGPVCFRYLDHRPAEAMSAARLVRFASTSSGVSTGAATGCSQRHQ